MPFFARPGSPLSQGIDAVPDSIANTANVSRIAVVWRTTTEATKECRQGMIAVGKAFANVSHIDFWVSIDVSALSDVLDNGKRRFNYNMAGCPRATVGNKLIPYKATGEAWDKAFEMANLTSYRGIDIWVRKLSEDLRAAGGKPSLHVFGEGDMLDFFPAISTQDQSSHKKHNDIRLTWPHKLEWFCMWYFRLSNASRAQYPSYIWSFDDDIWIRWPELLVTRYGVDRPADLLLPDRDGHGHDWNDPGPPKDPYRWWGRTLSYWTSVTTSALDKFLKATHQRFVGRIEEHACRFGPKFLANAMGFYQLWRHSPSEIFIPALAHWQKLDIKRYDDQYAIHHLCMNSTHTASIR